MTCPDRDAARTRRASSWVTRVSRRDRLMSGRSSSAERRAETAAWWPGPPCRGLPARWQRASQQSMHSPGYLPHSALLCGRFRRLIRPRSSAPAVDPPPPRPALRAAAVAGAIASFLSSSAASLLPTSLAQGGQQRPAYPLVHDEVHDAAHGLADLAYHGLHLALIRKVCRQGLAQPVEPGIDGRCETLGTERG